MSNKTDVNLKNWETLIEQLATTYTYNIKDMCKALKCSRSWINTYILPYLKRENKVISLGNGYPLGKSSIGQRAKPWSKIVENKLREIKKDKSIVIREIVWVDKKAFESLIYSNSIATQQIKCVPLDYFINDEDKEEFAKKYNHLSKMLDFVESSSEYRRIIKERTALFEENLSQKGRELLEVGERHSNKRGEVDKRLQVPLPDMDFPLWKAIHDIKDYGDTDEMIYRELFSRGAIRIELKIENPGKILCDSDEEKEQLKDGCKKFYTTDPEPLFNKYNLPCKTIQATVWEALKKDFI